MPRLAHTRRSNSQHQQQGMTPGHQLQQPQPARPRFGPDYSAPPGFSPTYRATPPTAARGFGSSFRSPSQRLGLHAAGGSLSADPKFDKLMEDLSMHQPYNPCAPLPPVSTTQQSSVSSTTQVDPNLDLDAVIARYAFRSHTCKAVLLSACLQNLICHAMH